jgi:hypothetical protein
VRNILAIFLIIGSFAFTAAAQSEGDLTKYFQGKQVTFRIDMPATKHGVNVYPERSQSLDYKEYKERLRTHGVSIHRSEIGTITKVKIKDKHIEVQLADRQRAISRFHIHYTQVESWMLSPLSLIDALNRYVEFTASDKASARLRQSSEFPAGYVRRGVVHLGPRSTYLREGLKKQEVLKLLGEPSLVSERTEGGKVITTYAKRPGPGSASVSPANGCHHGC